PASSPPVSSARSAVRTSCTASPPRWRCSTAPSAEPHRPIRPSAPDPLHRPIGPAPGPNVRLQRPSLPAPTSGGPSLQWSQLPVVPASSGPSRQWPYRARGNRAAGRDGSAVGSADWVVSGPDAEQGVRIVTDNVEVPGFVPVLSRGKHRSPRKGACFMEFASYLAGERWSDHPPCTHPLLAALARHVTDCTT